MLLTKGLEIEQYTGLKNGQVLPLSALISQSLKDFTIEPDQRNIEFVTSITKSYDELLASAIGQRWKLRDFLTKQNPEWTVVPSSILALPFEKEFIFSKPEDPYHQHISKTHGLSIITTSIHYNLGLDNPEEIIRIANLLRLEGPLTLALSAASPFYDGQFTGNQSERWLSFPAVPRFIPFFSSHQHFIDWTHEQLKTGEMFNIRHFWAPVRPNGSARPEKIDRLEIRIADINTKWKTIMAITAWLELRTLYFLHKQPDLKVDSNDFTLIDLTEENEKLAAIQGLSGHFSDWINENEDTCHKSIENRLPELYDLADELGLKEIMKPHFETIEDILTHGNEAQQKIAEYDEGMSVEEVMENWVQESLDEDIQVLNSISV